MNLYGDVYPIAFVILPHIMILTATKMGMYPAFHGDVYPIVFLILPHVRKTAIWRAVSKDDPSHG